MDFDYAHFALTEGRNGKDQEETAVSSPSREAYRKQLAETMNLNHTRILAFRNKPKDPAQLLPTDHSASSLHQQQLVRIYFLLYCIDPFGSANVLAIALGHTVYLWDASSGSTSELVTIDEEKGPVTSINWAPDGRHVALGLNNSEVQLWDSASNRQLRTLKGCHQSRVGSLAGHTQEICGLKWSGSGQQLASGGNDNVANLLATGGGGGDRTIKFWNTHTGACLNSVDTGSQVCSLLWSKNERELLSSHGFAHNQLTLWKYPSMRRRFAVKPYIHLLSPARRDSPRKHEETEMGKEMESPKEQSSYTVEQLVAVNPFNPEILPDLENYVNEQVTSQTYSLDANLCLLRLYQFEPERMNTHVVARILIKALMAMPAPDFSLCLFLIPERVQMEEQFKSLIVLSHYLETGRFQQFWDEAAKNRHILIETVPGFEQAIQAYATHLLSLSYQKVPRSVLAEAVNMDGASLDKFIEHQVTNSGWIVVKEDGSIVLPQNEFNHPELKKNTGENVPLEHIARIFPILG
ncbi:unnamed protein product [Brassica oleracea var. botrytis]|uniref:Eukaryotic translation initiation factor 3 subunit K n=2 Tax=Brassica napus TaxID=3708 RepID=A0A816IKQ3_BRANA|nr:unnamed protein product [Brassica napus]